MNSNLGQTADAVAFGPGGLKQGALRKLVAAELTKNASLYPITSNAKAFAEKHASAGTYATSLSLHALAHASKAQINIWA